MSELNYQQLRDNQFRIKVTHHPACYFKSYERRHRVELGYNELGMCHTSSTNIALHICRTN